MAQYFLPRGGQTLLPRNLTTWVFEEFRKQPTSHWNEEYGNALPTKVSGFMHSLKGKAVMYLCGSSRK
jgi:hypothetical protein